MLIKLFFDRSSSLIKISFDGFILTTCNETVLLEGLFLNLVCEVTSSISLISFTFLAC